MPAPGNGEQDLIRELQERVQAAAAAATPLRLVGGDTKSFYGREPSGEPCEVGEHRGILSYEPTELVVTARAGTPLQELEETLERAGQMLGFEPPGLGPGATLGGTIACNLSGPRRPHAGAARDFVLGTRVLNGKGEILAFGGEVMKNVAGYDLSRLMTGAMGTLGILLEVSLKVLPRPETELTLSQEVPVQEALDRLHRWSARPLPISASCHDGKHLFVRLSGTPGGVKAARAQIGGEEVAAGTEFWRSLREQEHPFFASSSPLWRISVASDTPPASIPGGWLYEWGGALRWLTTDAPAEEVRELARKSGGHATLFRTQGPRDQVFQPLPGPLMGVHRKLKAAFDPGGIFNPGRMYADL